MGTPIYVGQTNDLPERILSRFVKCEKEAAGKRTDGIERRIASLLHSGFVASYQVLDYQLTHLTSLISETNWARKCWNSGYHLANRAELQNAGGPPIGRGDVLRSWMLKFSLTEAIADDVRISIACEACSAALPIPLTKISELEKPAITISELGRVWRSEECTFCTIVGKRRVRVWVE
ncbi:hypothetical protein [Sphingomonas sp. RB1R13]|uniref:hypothetical protein n=1 Tax=Sphingomonas sp. RB1R13 TaxID=3096159 RepID=UPI002FC5DF29